MKAVFINLSIRPDSKRRLLPVGLAFVMTAAKKEGYDFDFIDMDINQQSMRELEGILSEKIYDVYALGCIVTGFKYARQVADIIKKINPGSVIIGGNSLSTSIPEILLSKTKFDIGVMGEGDITIVELFKALERGSSLLEIKGIVFKEDGQIIRTPPRPVVNNIDTISFPEWDIFELDKYKKYGHVNANTLSGSATFPFPLTSARGCPHSCTFCYHVFKGQKYRKYSAEKVIGEIKRLHEQYGCDFITFWDDLTFSTIKSVEAMVESLSRLCFRIGWEASTRAGVFKREHVDLIKEMKKAGCDNIAFSLENASPEILLAMNKKINMLQFVEQSKALWEGGVPPRTSVVFGYPQETPETIQRTLDICDECNIFPSVGFLLPLPGTKIYEWAKENGYIMDEVEYLERIGDRQDFHINLTQMKDEEFVNAVQTKLSALAEKQGLKFDNVFKTTTYQKPKKMRTFHE